MVDVCTDYSDNTEGGKRISPRVLGRISEKDDITAES